MIDNFSVALIYSIDDARNIFRSLDGYFVNRQNIMTVKALFTSFKFGFFFVRNSTIYHQEGNKSSKNKECPHPAKPKKGGNNCSAGKGSYCCEEPSSNHIKNSGNTINGTLSIPSSVGE